MTTTSEFDWMNAVKQAGWIGLTALAVQYIGADNALIMPILKNAPEALVKGEGARYIAVALTVAGSSLVFSGLSHYSGFRK